MKSMLQRGIIPFQLEIQQMPTMHGIRCMNSDDRYRNGDEE